MENHPFGRRICFAPPRPCAAAWTLWAPPPRPSRWWLGPGPPGPVSCFLSSFFSGCLWWVFFRFLFGSLWRRSFFLSLLFGSFVGVAQGGFPLNFPKDSALFSTLVLGTHQTSFALLSLGLLKPENSDWFGFRLVLGGSWKPLSRIKHGERQVSFRCPVDSAICLQFFAQTAKHWGSNLRYREWESVTPVPGPVFRLSSCILSVRCQIP